MNTKLGVTYTIDGADDMNIATRTLSTAIINQKQKLVGDPKDWTCSGSVLDLQDNHWQLMIPFSFLTAEI